MTPDRRNLLETVWASLYKQTCRCGRCDCISSDPFEIARRVLVHWSAQYRNLAASQARLAKGTGEIADKSEADLRRAERKYGRGGFDDWRERNDGLRAEARAYERRSVRFAHAALLFERLARGRHPFVAEEPRGAEVCAC